MLDTNYKSIRHFTYFNKFLFIVPTIIIFLFFISLVSLSSGAVSTTYNETFEYLLNFILNSSEIDPVKEKVISNEIMKSFEMLSPQVELIENFKTHQFLDLIEFDYPESWKISVPPIKDTDRMLALLENIRPETKVLDGQVYVEALSSYVVQDIEQEMQAVRRKLNKQGLLVGGLMETRDDIYFHENIEFGFAEVYEARDTENDLLQYELWIAAMATEEYFFFLYLVTPHRDTDYFIWARNTGAFKSMAKFIHPLEKETVVMDEDTPVQLE